MNKTVIKVGCTILLIIISLFIFSVYNSFNGNPVSKYISQKTLEKYLKQTYSDKNFRIDKGSYNFKFNHYTFKTIEIGAVDEKSGTAKEYNFSVRDGWNPRVSIDPIRESRIDRALSEKFNKEADLEMRKVLLPFVPSIKEVSTNIEVFKGEYTSDTVWNKSFKLDRPLNLHIILEVKNESKEDMLKIAEMIQSKLNEEKYEYSNCTINANIMNNDTDKDMYGYVKYAVSFKMNTQINIKNIRDLSKKEL